MGKFLNKITKYRNPLILYLLYIVLWLGIIGIIRLIFREDLPNALSRFIPFDGLLNELTFLFIFIVPLSGLVGYLIGGYILSPITIYIHKKIFGKKMVYGIHEQVPLDKIHLFSKAIFPALMAINLSTYFLTPEIVNFLLDTALVTEFENVMRVYVLVRLLGESVLLMLTFGLAMAPFSAVWFLEESGIIYSNKSDSWNGEQIDKPFLLKSMGDWFQTIFKSYAGLGAIITYILIIYNFIVNFIKDFGLPGNLLNIPSLILWLGLPIYLILATIPCLILNDIIKKHRIKFIKKVANKLGIKERAVISFELKRGEK